MKVWVIAIMLLLLACSKEVPLESGTPKIITPSSSDRPVIPRSNPAPEVQDAGEQPQGGEPSRPVFLVNQTPTSDLDVPVGNTIGQHHPLITRAQYPLLRHPPIRVDRNLVIGYEESFGFSFGPETTGRVIFGTDEIDDSIGTFLKFENGKPIFEYKVRLDRGTFQDIQGREITLLGHTYIIAEANNFSVTLYGKNIANNLVFTDGQVLYVNSSGRTDTLARVRGNTIAFELFANGKDRGDILLSPGERLGDNVGKLKLMSAFFDIRYKGAPLQNVTQIALRRSAYGYNLIVPLRTGTAEFSVVEYDAGKLVLGRTTDQLHLTPCANYCIAPEDTLLLTSPDGKTYMLRYGGASENPKLLNFYDPGGNHYQYEFVGTPGLDAKANIILEKYAFPVRISAKTKSPGLFNISVNQGFRNGRVEIVAVDGTIIRIGDPQNMSVPFDVIVPASRTLSKRDELLRLNLTYGNGWYIASNATFVEDLNSTHTIAQTSNILIDFTRKDRGLPLNVGHDATLFVSRTPIYGIVSLEG
jgi:hypothetical protein